MNSAGLASWHACCNPSLNTFGEGTHNMLDVFKIGFALAVGVLGFQAQASARPQYFKIKNLIYAGTGCPAGTVAENVSLDGQAFTLLFDSFVAEAGPGLPLSASRKNCQLNLTFDCPAGWKFALVNLDARGFAALDHGVTGVQQTSFYFQGSAMTGRIDRTIHGPHSADYQVRDTLPAASRQWGTCGRSARSLNINTAVRVDNFRNRAGSGLLTADSIDGSLVQTYGIVWERESL